MQHWHYNQPKKLPPATHYISYLYRHFSSKAKQVQPADNIITDILHGEVKVHFILSCNIFLITMSCYFAIQLPITNNVIIIMPVYILVNSFVINKESKIYSQNPLKHISTSNRYNSPFFPLLIYKFIDVLSGLVTIDIN